MITTLPRMTDVQTSWARIVAWCREHAPATADAMTDRCSEAEIAAAEETIGERFPDDLREFFRVVGGTTDGTYFGSVLPCGYAPMPMAQVLDTWRMMLDIRGSGLTEAGQIAGTQSPSWAPQWVPIGGDDCGYHLVVDLRQGEARGCIMEFDKVEGCGFPPQWPSVAAMLGEVADALEGNRVAFGHRPRCEPDGRLFWDLPKGLWVDNYPLSTYDLDRSLREFANEARAGRKSELVTAQVATVVAELVATAESLEAERAARYDDPDPRDDLALAAYASAHGGSAGLADRVESLGARLIELATPHQDTTAEYERVKAPLIPATIRESGDVVIDGEVSWPRLVAGLGWFLKSTDRQPS
jgi:cell wall assembly regulator SMI1